MRFQGSFLPAPGAPEPGDRWRLTDSVRVETARLAVALDAAGLTAEVSEQRTDPDSDPDGAFAQLDLDSSHTAGGTLVYLYENGGGIDVDGWSDEEQAEVVAVLSVVRIVAQATGRVLRPQDAEQLAALAARHGVRPDGSAARARRRSEDQVIAELTGIVAAAGLPAERPRPAHLVSSPLLDALVATVDEHEERGPVVRYFWPLPGSVSLHREPAANDDPLIGTDAIRLVERLGDELGDERTGRPTEIEVQVRRRLGRRSVHATVRFDVMPERDWATGTFLPFGWEATLEHMARRDPEWIPAWAQQCIAVLRSAGRAL